MWMLPGSSNKTSSSSAKLKDRRDSDEGVKKRIVGLALFSPPPYQFSYNMLSTLKWTELNHNYGSLD